MSGGEPAGACADCAWARRVVAKSDSVFLLCARSESDPKFDKYPRLPVVACPGHEPRGGGTML